MASQPRGRKENRPGTPEAGPSTFPGSSASHRSGSASSNKSTKSVLRPVKSSRDGSAGTITSLESAGSIATVFQRSGSPSPVPSASSPRQPVDLEVRTRSPSSIPKNLEDLKRRIYLHKFEGSVIEEAEAFKSRSLTNADLQVALVYAYDILQMTIAEYHAMVVRNGAAANMEEAAEGADLGYFDIADDADSSNIIPIAHLSRVHLVARIVDRKTRPTIAFFCILRSRIRMWVWTDGRNYLSHELRRELLHSWIDKKDRLDFVSGYPVKLYQSHFTFKDINDAAAYAKDRRRFWVSHYRELWRRCARLSLHVSMKAAGCRHPATIEASDWKTKDVVDFDVMDDDSIRNYKWPVQDLPIPFGKWMIIVDPFASEDEQWKQRNWRPSIARYAQKAQEARACYEKLSTVLENSYADSDASPPELVEDDTTG